MKIKQVASLTALAVCAALSTSAMAQSVVNFEGYVVDEACTITAGTGNLVTLPVVSLSSLATQGASAGLTAFPVKLENCKKNGTTQDGTYQVEFSDPSAVNDRLPNQAAGGAADVSLRLLSNENEWLDVARWPTGNTRPVAEDSGVVVTGGTGVGTYKVEYVADSNNVTAGKVEAKATMTTNFL